MKITLYLITFGSLLLSYPYFCTPNPKHETSNHAFNYNFVIDTITKVIIGALSAAITHAGIKTKFQSPYTPLVVAVAGMAGFTAGQWIVRPKSASLEHAMSDFMASYLIIFTLAKLQSLERFANSYSEYDLIAQQSNTYAYAYPFIELGLGLLYLTRTALSIVNPITLCLSIINSIGVIQRMRDTQLSQTPPCACMGPLLKVPIGPITLLENLLMAGMAILMMKH